MRLTPRNPSVHPSGGLRHVEKTSGMEFRDDSWEQMKAKVYRHRLAKIEEQQSEDGYDIAAGWIERLMHDLCIQNPHVEADVLNDDGTSNERWIGISDLKRFYHSVEKFIAGGMQWQTPEVARERLKACTAGEEGGRKCRWHVKVSGCLGCSGMLDVVSSLAGKPDMGAHSDQILSCSKCGCDCTTKALMPIEVAYDKSLDWPEWCWVHKESQRIAEQND